MKRTLVSRIIAVLGLLSIASVVVAGNLGRIPGQLPAQPAAPANQSSPFVGTWNCDYANNLPNVPTDTWMYSFAMAVYPNGQFEAQGNYWANSAGYWDPFYISGAWTVEQGNFSAQGQASYQSGWGSPWVMVAPMTMDGVLSFRNVSERGEFVIYCQRVG